MASQDPREERVRQAYDTVATEYAAAIRDELAGKPLDRALLAAVAEMAAGGTVADIGCGPGHVAAHLAGLGADVVGIDLSRSMVEIARADHPQVRFEVASMTDLPQADGSLAAAVLMYSIIHLGPADRDRTIAELRRVLQPGGIALLAFHIRSEEFQPGDVNRLTTWFGHSVDVEGYFLEPEVVLDDLERHGLDIVSVMTRMPQVMINVRDVDKNALGGNAAVQAAVADAERDLGDDGRVLLRKSGTEPVVRVMVEADTAERAEAVCERLVEVVRSELALAPAV